MDYSLLLKRRNRDDSPPRVDSLISRINHDYDSKFISLIGKKECFYLSDYNKRFFTWCHWYSHFIGINILNLHNRKITIHIKTLDKNNEEKEEGLIITFNKENKRYYSKVPIIESHCLFLYTNFPEETSKKGRISLPTVFSKQILKVKSPGKKDLEVLIPNIARRSNRPNLDKKLRKKTILLVIFEKKKELKYHIVVG